MADTWRVIVVCYRIREKPIPEITGYAVDKQPPPKISNIIATSLVRWCDSIIVFFSFRVVVIIPVGAKLPSCVSFFCFLRNAR